MPTTDPQRRKLFEAEVLPHLDAMQRTALRLTRSQSDADDLVQDAVLKAYRFFDHYESGTNIRAWLLKILTNLFFSKHRRNHLDGEVRSMADSDPIADGWMGAATMGPNRDPEGIVERPLLGASIARAMDDLPEEFRAVLVLADIEGLTYREVADAMGSPMGTVMSRLHRARRAVAQKLGIQMPEEDRSARESAATAVVSLDAYKKRKEAAG
jgi:RNA polymerase sigma-70 factor (ECF subfamily)